MTPLQCSLSFLLVSGWIVSVKGNSVVKKSESPYACCENPTIHFDPNGETSFVVDKKTIAIHKKSSSKCISPCLKIEGGRMELDHCTNVNSTAVYTLKNVIAESRTYYYGEPCTGYSPGPHGLLLLLAVAITGLFDVY